MNSQPSTSDWLAVNRDAIAQRLSWLHEQPEGVLFFEPSGVHFVMVEKVKSQLRLALLGQVSLTSTLAQSRLDLDDPLYLVAPYSQAAMLGLVWPQEPRRIYLAGFGGGRLPLVLHHFFPEAKIECTEIDPTLIEVATNFFGVQLDERLRVICQDGREYLAQCDRGIEYDIIFIDVVLGNGYMPYCFATKEFYELCQTRLSKQGVVVVNLLNKGSFYTEKLKTIKSCFEQVYFWLLEGGNTVVIGSNNNLLAVPERLRRAESLQEQHQFPFPFMERAFEVKMGSQLPDYLPNFEQAQILEDASVPSAYFNDLPSFNTVFATVGKDNPCPCGSGKKFQHCHG